MTARLTTDHAASSYGIPVLVLEDGTALGPFEAVVDGYAIGDATADEGQRLEAARYRLNAIGDAR